MRIWLDLKGVERKNGWMSLEYRNPETNRSDWQSLSATTLIGAGLLGHVVFALWAIAAPQPLLWFPLIASFILTIVGVVWWLLNRRGLS